MCRAGLYSYQSEPYFLLKRLKIMVVNFGNISMKFCRLQAPKRTWTLHSMHSLSLLNSRDHVECVEVIVLTREPACLSRASLEELAGMQRTGRAVNTTSTRHQCPVRRGGSNLMNPVTSFNYLRVFRAVVNILENSRSMLMPSPVCDLAFFVMQRN